MQEANATSIEYFRDLERVADLLNGILFHGEGIITAGNLLEKNPVIHKITEKDGKITAAENIPDLSIMVMLNDVHFLVMFQGQTLTHYAMPVRVLNERGTDYNNQWKELKKKHGELKDLKSPEKPGRIFVQNETGRYFLSSDAHNRVFWRKALDCSQKYGRTSPYKTFSQGTAEIF